MATSKTQKCEFSCENQGIEYTTYNYIYQPTINGRKCTGTFTAAKPSSASCGPKWQKIANGFMCEKHVNDFFPERCPICGLEDANADHPDRCANCGISCFDETREPFAKKPKLFLGIRSVEDYLCDGLKKYYS